MKGVRIKRTVLNFCLILVSGCGSGTLPLNIEIEDSNLVEIPLDNDEAVFSHISHFQNFGVIKLETKKGFLVSEVTKVDVLEDHIIIFDKPQEAILIFTSDGSALAKIEAIGRGVNELPTFSGYFFNKRTKQICIAYPPRNLLYKYSLNGALETVEEVEGPIWHHFTIDENGNSSVLFMNNLLGIDDADLIYYDQNGSPLKKMLPSRPFLKEVVYHDIVNPMTSYKDSTFFIRWLDQYIYCIKDGELFRKYYFNFGNLSYPDKSDYLLKDEMGGLKLDGLPSSIEGLFLTDEFIYFHFVISGRVFPCYFEIKTHKLYRVAEYRFNGGANLIPDLLVGSSEDFFIYRLSALNFKKQMQILTEFEHDSLQRQQMDTLITINRETEANDNPLLIYYKPGF